MPTDAPTTSPFPAPPRVKAEGIPRDALFSWNTRQDFIAALTAALCVTSKPDAYDHDDTRPSAPTSPTGHARRIADVLQLLKNAAPSATTSVVKQWPAKLRMPEDDGA